MRSQRSISGIRGFLRRPHRATHETLRTFWMRVLGYFENEDEAIKNTKGVIENNHGKYTTKIVFKVRNQFTY